MPVDHERRLVLIHPRKTAGSTVGRLLGLDGPEHAPTKHKHFYQIYDEIGAEAWNSYTVISMIRNPFDTVVSDYHFNRKLYERGRHDERRTFCMQHDVNAYALKFHRATFRALRDEDGELRLTRENNLICGKRGEIKVDHWLRQEHLAKDIAALRAATGIDISLDETRVNPSDNPGPDVLSPASRAALQRSCEAIFRAFYPEALPSTSYFEQDAHVVRYPAMYLPGGNQRWRGTFDKAAFDSGTYFTAIGAAQTMGRFVETPFVDLLAQETGLWGVNLGRGAAGPRDFMGRGVIDVINRGKFCIVQAMSARSSKNAFFDPQTHKNIFGIDAKEVGVANFAQQILQRVVEYGEEDFAQEFPRIVRAGWVQENAALAAKIKVPTIFFWFSDRTPEYDAHGRSVHGLTGGFPQLVDETAFEAASAHFTHAASCTSLRGRDHQILTDGKPAKLKIGQKYVETNHYYPSPEMHEDASAALLPSVNEILQGETAAH